MGDELIILSYFQKNRMFFIISFKQKPVE